MDIIYRNFQNGDEHQLAKVFNTCFHLGGMGFARTPKSIIWRYVQRPYAKPEEIHIAENSDTGEIAGMVFSPIRRYLIKRNLIKTGCINDVAVLPKYGKQGIAQQLMKNTIHFMNKENCEISTLSADGAGFAREKIYDPMGWKDIHESDIFFSLNWKSFSRFTPIILLFPYLKRKIIPKLSLFRKFNEWVDSNNIQIHYIKSSQEKTKNFLLKKLHRIYLKSMQFFWKSYVYFDEKEWYYFRTQQYIPSLSPFFVILRKNNQIIGFSSFLKQWMYFEKFGFHLPLGIIRDWHINPEFVKTNHDIFFTLGSLLKQSEKLTLARGCIGTLINLPKIKNYYTHLLYHLRYNRVSGPNYMVNVILQEKNLPLTEMQPFLLSYGDIFMYP